MSEQFRELTLLGATGAVRTEQFEGRDHLVVPIVALVEGVIQAMNAPAPELVLADQFSVAPGGWNGRPIFLGHPMRDGRPVSGNSPETLKASLGRVFNARVSGKRLLMDAWIDPERVKANGAERLLERLTKQEMVEVSTGAFIVLDDRSGQHHGKEYRGVWSMIVPDHLALLPDGLTGACSIAMGCGTHRAASAYLVTAEGLEEVPMAELYTMRSISQEERDKIPAEDFAGKNRSFFIVKPEDVSAAAKSVGRGGSDNYSSDELKKRITAIAYRKGDAFVAQLPESWKKKKKADQKNAEGWRAAVRDRVKALMTRLSGVPLKAEVKALLTWDGQETPQEVASEEASELIQYQTLQTLLKQCGTSYDEADRLISDLIAAEEEDATKTSEDEAAEEEIEGAQLESLTAHCLAMISSLSAICSLSRKLTADDQPALMAMRVAIGKRNSMSDQTLIQTMHDHAVKLGADCPGTMKAASSPCGCGQSADKLTGEVTDMERKDRIAALLACEHNPYKDQKGLEASSDESLTTLEVHCKNATVLKAAAKKSEEEKVAAEAALKAAQKPKTDEEWLAEAPESLRMLVTDKKAEDAKRRSVLVASLKTAQSEYTEAELSAMDLKTLERTSRLAKVEPINYGPNGAHEEQESDVYLKPPDGYRMALDARAKIQKGVN